MLYLALDYEICNKDSCNSVDATGFFPQSYVAKTSKPVKHSVGLEDSDIFKYNSIPAYTDEETTTTGPVIITTVAPSFTCFICDARSDDGNITGTIINTIVQLYNS